MGNKDKTWDENATASTNARDREQESRDTALAKTIAAAVAVALAQQKAKETQSIAEAVALQTRSIAEVAQQTKSITETFSRQMEKTHAQYEEILKASRTQNFPSTLKVTSSSEGFRVMGISKIKVSQRSRDGGTVRPSSARQSMTH